MKKVFLCAAAVAMLGLAACSNKDNTAADTASIDSVDVTVAEADSVSVDTANGDTTVTVAQEVVETVTPAGN